MSLPRKKLPGEKHYTEEMLPWIQRRVNDSEFEKQFSGWIPNPGFEEDESVILLFDVERPNGNAKLIRQPVFND